MATDSTQSKDRLSPGWVRRSLSPFTKKSAPKTDSQPSTSDGLLSPHPPSTRDRSSSNASRSTKSSRSGSSRASFRGVVQRLRSSSSASSLGRKSQDGDVNDIHDWFQGFRRYNQIVSTQTAAIEPYDSQSLAKITKPLTKNCGGNLIHGLPEAAFDFSLLWCPSGDITRLDSSEPSWSWTAYTGAVNFPFDPTTCPDVYTAPKSDGELFRSEITHFTIGLKSAPYSIRRDKSPALRTKFPPYFHAPWGSDASTDSNTLRFTTETISADGFTTEALHFSGKEIPCSQLLDAEIRHCGVLMAPHSSISAPSSVPGTYEFVALSRSLRRAEPAAHNRQAVDATVHPMGTPIWDGQRFVWDQVVADFDEEVFAEGEWKVLNVMLVKWVGDGEYAERVAVGRIHEDVWRAKGPSRREVVLR